MAFLHLATAASLHHFIREHQAGYAINGAHLPMLAGAALQLAVSAYAGAGEREIAG